MRKKLCYGKVLKTALDLAYSYDYINEALVVRQMRPSILQLIFAFSLVQNSIIGIYPYIIR